MGIKLNNNIMADKQAKSSEKSRIIMVVDETGSMQRHKPVTISSFNEWLDSNRTKEEDEDHHPKFSLIKFNTVTKLQEYESVETAPRLTNENYSPNNMTALYDALGETLENYKEENDNIMVILTDGEENSSRKWTQKMIQEKIKMFTEEKGWIFHYLGANQDAWAVGNSIGISDKKFTTTYSADDGGFDHAFAQNMVQTKCYRGVQARKKKGMFVPSMKDLKVPTIDKASYLSSKGSSNQAPSFHSNVTVAADNVAKPVQEKTLFTSSGGGLFGSNSNRTMNQQRPMMKKKAPKKFVQRPPMQQMVQQQQIQLDDQVEAMEDANQIQQVIQQSQQNANQIQQDFNQLYLNSDADMQEALKNSLNENY